MINLKNYYSSLDSRARFGVLAGAAVIVLGTALVLWWVFSTKQQLLFGNLREADAAEIAQSLNEWKVPHHFTDDGAGILVDAKQVHETRMRLVSAGVPRGGHVGFELFDDNDFGVTEFAQRINYQRALQGEIERTIAAMPGVASVRVHLAIKRPGLFLSRQEESKASVALDLAPSATLGSKQVAGIKSLVAAAVEGLSPDAVVVIGPGGVPLGGNLSAGGLDLSGQQEGASQTASVIEQRISNLLANALGNREASVSVDVRLNFDRVHKTSERLLAQPGSDHGLVTKRQTSGIKPTEAGAPIGLPEEQVEYAHGTEREEVTRASGTVERLSVAVVLPRALSTTEIDHLRRLISASAGLDENRGDRLEMAVAPPRIAPAVQQPGVQSGGAVGNLPSLDKAENHVWSALAGAAGVLLGLLVAWMLRRNRRSLSPQESEAAAAKIRAWLTEEQRAS